MVIPPRLNIMLGILLDSDNPVSVDALAGQLNASRRTVFRELENVDMVLAPYGLRLQTVVGRGMVLHGGEDGKSKLARTLGSAGPAPLGREHRLKLLEIALLDAGDMQKLFYYADHLGVSEATVSNDLDRLQPRFEGFGLALYRKPGQGVEVRGEEADFRRMLLSCLSRADAAGAAMRAESLSEALGYPSPAIEQGVRELIYVRLAPHIDWITDESLSMLSHALMVAVDRVGKRRFVSESMLSKRAEGLPHHMADKLCDALEIHFGLGFSLEERMAVEKLVQACRAKQYSPLDPNDASDYSRVQSLAYKMIDRFDQKLSHTLKLNDDLIQGLSLHLWSAIVRMQQHIELDADLVKQIEQEFPNLIDKCRRAVLVLEEEYGLSVPDSELAFIASHFGAALMHLGERSTRGRIPKAGLVCVSGIGVSYMMASQVRTHFKGGLDVEICDWNNEEEWRQNDMLISTIPLDYTERPVVRVNPVLSTQDYEAITLVVDEIAARPPARPEGVEAGTLLSRLEKTDKRIKQIQALLEGFGCNYIHPDCSFDELARHAGYRYGVEQGSGSAIYHDLIARERIATQVVHQLDIVLLHARTEGVAQPVVGLIAPEGGAFLDEHFRGARACLVLLMPRDGDKGLSEIMGRLSSALVEDEVFLAAVQNAETNLVLVRIEAVMKDYLWEHWNQNI